MDYQVAEEDIWAYQEYLVSEEHGKGTVEKYLRDIRSFFVWASGRMVGKRLAAAWKEHLVMEGYSGIYGMDTMQGKASADTADAVSEAGTGFTAKRI